MSLKVIQYGVEPFDARVPSWPVASSKRSDMIFKSGKDFTFNEKIPFDCGSVIMDYTGTIKICATEINICSGSILRAHKIILDVGSGGTINILDDDPDAIYRTTIVGLQTLQIQCKLLKVDGADIVKPIGDYSETIEMDSFSHVTLTTKWLEERG